MSRLEIENLRVQFMSRSGPVPALRGVNLSVDGGRVGIVGESGSGKSTMGRAIMGLLPLTAQVSASRFRFADVDLLAASAAKKRALRGRRIGLIMQDPRYALNPVMTAGAQIAECFRLHHGLVCRAAKSRALDLLAAVRINDPETAYDQYPHQLSGGMGQRVMIAIALAGEPELLIADEPTSALDASVRTSFLGLLDQIIRERGMSLILISHDLNLVANFCDRVVVLYGGQVMEECTATDLAAPHHAYTRALAACRPSLTERLPELRTFTRDPAWLEAQP
ncbi:ABC transporter ATP-binding protein [Pseudaminobacter soli (ex Li et al. 2025)]|uniref:Peptide ABC transporter ATP-binding protein n=1 Tax=Pseudaminobacter soli (ex Li et al. 2025) TaxID=1295366 RepID=A0A2P7S3S3_9HYPH|nr:ABC transporter ATP-binding protein [Mesorhizobium soli]PSJ57132.1 peptide ABC transporter ATP-binding protein [Mesorhizobium soli]